MTAVPGPIQYTGGGAGSTAQPLLNSMGLPYPSDDQEIVEGAATFRYFADVINSRVSSANTSVPVGSITAYGGNTPPPGGMWLMCNGDPFDPVAYDTLHRVLGNAVRLPDLRSRFVLGASPTGGTGVPATVVGSTGGSALIERKHLPAHGHTASGSASGTTNSVRVGGGSHTHWLYAQSVAGFAPSNTKSALVYRAMPASPALTDFAGREQTWLDWAAGSQHPGHVHDDHSHTISGATVTGSVTDFPAGGVAGGVQSQFMPPYYALIFIIKAI
jgi:microcystin-dependent protein